MQSFPPARTLTLCTATVMLGASAHSQLWESCDFATFDGEGNGSNYGFVADNAGDVDGDGFNDVIVSAPAFEGGAGKVYVYSGHTGALLFDFVGAPGENAGRSVASAGDVDGDGFDDVIIGAPGSGSMAGKAYVLAGPNGAFERMHSAGVAGDRFGASVGGGGQDVDGDGFDDVIIGAPNDDSAFLNAGRAFVFSGSDGGELQRVDGLAAGDNLGHAVDLIGDGNSDGRSEFILGAPGAGPSNKGEAYVHWGHDGSLRCTLSPDANAVAFGSWFIGHAGDVDADGTQDFFVTDWQSASLGSTTGQVRVYSGSDCALLHEFNGRSSGVGYGIGRGHLGDYDGDGHDDLFFGSWLDSLGGSGAGSGTIRSGADGSILAEFHGDVNGDNLGYDACGLDDVDGDGVPDVVLTSINHGAAGVMYVIPGAPRPPHNYCETSPNSVGAGATMGYRRSTSIAAGEFRLRAKDAVPGEIGIFLYSSGEARFPLSDGTFCLGSPFRRLTGALTVNAQGTRIYIVDFSAPALASLVPGTSANFQFWYRDPSQGSGANLTDALRVEFCP
jgi:hypothetical protein